MLPPIKILLFIKNRLMDGRKIEELICLFCVTYLRDGNDSQGCKNERFHLIFPIYNDYYLNYIIKRIYNYLYFRM